MCNTLYNIYVYVCNTLGKALNKAPFELHTMSKINCVQVCFLPLVCKILE